MRRRRLDQGSADAEPWSRRRLQVVLATLVAVGVLLSAGLGLGAVLVVQGAVAQDGGGGGSKAAAGAAERRADGVSARDEIAGAAMLQVDQDDALPGPPAAVPAPSIAIPLSTSTGAAGVPSGFRRSPEGAVAQLAAIDTEVLHAMSIRRVNEVHQAWAMPGAPSVAQWEMTRNVQAFLGTAGMTDELAPTAVVTALPVAAQVKGSDGPDWVLACVLLQVRATVTTTSQLGYGRCERMQWSRAEHRWMIAPGPAPAPAPSTWPGTDRAIEAGWRSWTDALPEGTSPAGEG